LGGPLILTGLFMVLALLLFLALFLAEEIGACAHSCEDE
jgi:hypothetical protein